MCMESEVGPDMRKEEIDEMIKDERDCEGDKYEESKCQGIGKKKEKRDCKVC